MEKLESLGFLQELLSEASVANASALVCPSSQTSLLTPSIFLPTPLFWGVFEAGSRSEGWQSLELEPVIAAVNNCSNAVPSTGTAFVASPYKQRVSTVPWNVFDSQRFQDHATSLSEPLWVVFLTVPWLLPGTKTGGALQKVPPETRIPRFRRGC